MLFNVQKTQFIDKSLACLSGIILFYLTFNKITLNLTNMPRMIYDYTKSVLERVSFDPILFQKELRKAMKNLLPYEFEQLKKWLQYFTSGKPELQECMTLVIE